MLEQRRFAMCECGVIYDLATGIKIDTPTLIQPDKSFGDKDRCLACFLENKEAWPKG